jgi:hypothetical protein
LVLPCPAARLSSNKNTVIYKLQFVVGLKKSIDPLFLQDLDKWLQGLGAQGFLACVFIGAAEFLVFVFAVGMEGEQLAAAGAGFVQTAGKAMGIVYGVIEPWDYGDAGQHIESSGDGRAHIGKGQLVGNAGTPKMPFAVPVFHIKEQQAGQGGNLLEDCRLGEARGLDGRMDALFVQGLQQGDGKVWLAEDFAA